MRRADPRRTCVGCRTERPKNELARIVLMPDGSVVTDPSGKQPGRGAYVCPGPDCLETALARRALERAFKRPVPVEAAERLKQEAAGQTE